VSLHRDLIEQAQHLATRESKRPRQASFRRAVSSAYYAVFHMLTNDAVRRLVPDTPGPLRTQVQRAFAHAEMRTACEQFAKSLGAFSRLLLSPVEPDLQIVAKAFVELQHQRHLADYDLSRDFDRIEVLGIIGQAKAAISAWARVRNTPNANVFLAALLLNSRWNR
jgi:hypothetical protein